MTAALTFEQFIATLIAVSVALSAVMSGGWFVWHVTRNSGWVDTVWTFGLGVVGCAGALWPLVSPEQVSWRAAFLSALIAFWSLRLGLHIAHRTRGIIDDPRYAKLLRDWQGDAQMQMFWLLQKQALVSIPLALSMILAAWNPAPGIRAQDVVGLVVLAAGIIGEGISDAQLRRFRADPAHRGRLCDVRLWRWSRHPNYFFEWLSWIAYPLFAIDLGGDYVWGYVALAGPLCMYWLLVHVSGIPPLEAHMLERHHDEFRAYQARTSAFFPAPPRAI